MQMYTIERRQCNIVFRMLPLLRIAAPAYLFCYASLVKWTGVLIQVISTPRRADITVSALPK